MLLNALPLLQDVLPIQLTDEDLARVQSGRLCMLRPEVNFSYHSSVPFTARACSLIFSSCHCRGYQSSRSHQLVSSIQQNLLLAFHLAAARHLSVSALSLLIVSVSMVLLYTPLRLSITAQSSQFHQLLSP